MLHRYIIETDNDECSKWVIPFLVMISTVTGSSKSLRITEVEQGDQIRLVTPRGNGHDLSTVRYHAIGQHDAIALLGETTVIGMVFAHILEHGPCTVREIRQAKPGLSDKSLQSVVWKLRHSGLVEARAIQ